MMNKGIPNMLRISEIPESERDGAAPIRLRMVLNK
jgi:hypothetical protein